MTTDASTKTVLLPAAVRVPAFGLGTWTLGDDPAKRAEELATLRLGLDLGARLIDTAEMYGEGRAEELVGEAIANRRDQVFLVTKCYPHHGTRRGARVACEGSLRRLKVDQIDLYLLHWRGDVPLAETVAAFRELQREGLIRHWGVSNFDLADMEELHAIDGGDEVQTDQILYNLARRGAEWDLLPWLREQRIPVMAYSPIEQAKLLRDAKLVDFARHNGRTPSQVALAWLLSRDDVIVIPKAGRRDHLQDDLGALAHPLTPDQLAELDRYFPPPDGPRPLETI
jgi:diketogulonate reductase-like aldo/keto reductase